MLCEACYKDKTNQAYLWHTSETCPVCYDCIRDYLKENERE